MYAEQRHRQILDAITASGRVGASALADRFDVTTETIRRDLDQLADRGLLVRVHGGAVAPRTTVVEPDLAARTAENTEAKRRIAAAARELLPTDRGASIALDAGSTTAQLVPHLSGRHGTVVTHALSIAQAAIGVPGLPVLLLPGRVRPETGAAVGAATVDALRALAPDIAFLGCNGLDSDAFTTPDADEAAVKATIVERSARRIVLADSSKAGTRHLVAFAQLADVDVVVTDAGLPEEIATSLIENGIEVIRA